MDGIIANDRKKYKHLRILPLECNANKSSEHLVIIASLLSLLIIIFMFVVVIVIIRLNGLLHVRYMICVGK